MSGRVTIARRGGAYERQPDEWYVEPVWATALLLLAERFARRLWDPACGRGNVVRAALAAGHSIFRTDLRDRHCPGFDGTLDFLADLDGAELAEARRVLALHGMRPGAFDVVTNPPYGRGRLAAAFVDRALELGARKVAVFVEDTFLASEERWARFAGPVVGRGHPGSPCAGRGHPRTPGPERWPLRRVYHLSSRPSCPPGEAYEAVVAAGGTPSGGRANFVWLVFERGRRGPVETRWLCRADPPDTSAGRPSGEPDPGRPSGEPPAAHLQPEETER